MKMTPTPFPSFPTTRDAPTTLASLVGAVFGPVSPPHININIEYLFYYRSPFFFRNKHSLMLLYARKTKKKSKLNAKHMKLHVGGWPCSAQPPDAAMKSRSPLLPSLTIPSPSPPRAASPLQHQRASERYRRTSGAPKCTCAPEIGNE